MRSIHFMLNMYGHLVPQCKTNAAQSVGKRHRYTFGNEFNGSETGLTG
jgi:hypothetical protein